MALAVNLKKIRRL